ncbi:F0F1 ATP synthase subunit B' [Gloeomargaritaceae cyanobacterium AH-226-B11]|jgi:F-type H+-transporting ATPase subunit b|nr:F0F1 ATP synthase subunit B' [Gloeomargaritaceae cyanobacterium AH-226-B11]
MVNISTLIASSEVNGPGGLFDFNATLPLVAIQFVLLMVILNVLFYSPLSTVISERNEFILTTLANASETLAKANEMTAEYEQQLETVRKQAQLEITNSQKIHKEILEIELDISQKYIDNLLDKLTKDILNKKEIALNSLETVTQSLCTEIESKLSI